MVYHPEKHHIHKAGWLRAAVLGANDGIISTSSLVIGVASAMPDHRSIFISGAAGLVAGALSMAAGEYVSVSSQSDIEKADLAREKKELAEQPEFELKELTGIYIKRGLKAELAKEVAMQLTAHDALKAHSRDELGITDLSRARPTQAAMASALAFSVGGVVPLVVLSLVPLTVFVPTTYLVCVLLLAGLGALSAKLSGAKPLRAVFRVVIWGTLAMGLTALIGTLIGN